MENQGQPQTISARLAPPSYAEAMGLGAAPKYDQPVISSSQQTHGQPLQVPAYPVQSSSPGYPYQNSYYLNGDNPPPYNTTCTGQTTSRQPTSVECIVVTEEVQDPRRKAHQSCCSRRIIIFVTFTFLTLYLAKLIVSVVRFA